MPGRLPAGLSRRKYAALLVLLLVVLAIETFNGTERLRSDAMRAVLTIAIWIIVFERPRERAITAAVLFTSLLISGGRYFGVAGHDYPLSLADQVLLILYLW